MLPPLSTTSKFDTRGLGLSLFPPSIDAMGGTGASHSNLHNNINEQYLSAALKKKQIAKSKQPSNTNSRELRLLDTVLEID